MTRKDNKGYVLVTSLLMLLVLTVIGMAAIGTSTIENLLSGNIRLKERNEVRADGCSELGLMVIERSVRYEDLRGFTNIVTDSNLPHELRSGAFDSDTLTASNADVICDSGGTSAVADIDMMYPRAMPGSALEFASGYEGLGKSGSFGGYSFFYRINASGAGLMNSTTNIGSIYRYVP